MDVLMPPSSKRSQSRPERFRPGRCDHYICGPERMYPLRYKAALATLGVDGGPDQVRNCSPRFPALRGLHPKRKPANGANTARLWRSSSTAPAAP